MTGPLRFCCEVPGPVWEASFCVGVKFARTSSYPHLPAFTRIYPHLPAFGPAD